MTGILPRRLSTMESHRHTGRGHSCCKTPPLPTAGTSRVGTDARNRGIMSQGFSTHRKIEFEYPDAAGYPDGTGTLYEGTDEDDREIDGTQRAVSSDGDSRDD